MKADDGMVAINGGCHGYCQRESDMFRLSEGHNFDSEVLSSYNLDVSARFHHPIRNVLLRALGIENIADLDFRKIYYVA